MKRKFKGYFIGIIVLMAVMLTGCEGKEVNERAFVQLMDIDRNNDVYAVNIQVYNSESSDGNPDISKANSKSYSGTGSTIYEAIANAELNAGKSLFLGHIKLIILGSGITQPADELPVLLKEKVSPSCPVAYSKNPQSVTDTFMSEGLFSADRLMRIMETYVKSGKCVYTTLASVTENTGYLKAASAIPIIKAENDSVSFDGITFAQVDGIDGELPEEDIAGYRLLHNDISAEDKITVPVSVGDKTATAVITSATTERSAEFVSDKLSVNATVKLKIIVTENRFDLSEQQISEAVCKSVQDSCISAFSTAVWYSGCDIFDIGKLVRRDCGDYLDTYNSNSEQFLKDSVLNITVTAVSQ